MGMMLNLTFLFIFVKSFYRIYHIFKMEHSNNPTLQHNIPNIQEDSLELMLISNLDSTIPEEEMGLTEIERSIFDCAAKGMTTEQIASQLFRSVNTIKTHRTRLFKKLHVSSINEALVFVSNYNL